MKLSEELFESVIGCDPRNVEGRRSDRRVKARVHLSGRVNLIPISKTVSRQMISAHIRDFSQEGMGLLISKPVAAGDSILLQLPLKKAKKWVICTVARSEKVGPDLYVLGVKYERMAEAAHVANAVA